MAVLNWVVGMSKSERAGLGHRMQGVAAEVQRTPLVQGRIDRHESALVVALILEYARGHDLSPAEAESLLANPDRAGLRSLEALGLTEKPGAQPGRDAQTRPGRSAPPPSRTPGR